MCVGSYDRRMWLKMPRKILFTTESLMKFVYRARERWRDFEVVRIEQHYSRQVLYIRVNEARVKLIVYSDGRIRAYSSKLPGLAYAVKRLAERVLGIDREYRSAEG